MKKRILAAVLLALTVITSTVACSKEIDCAICDEHKNGTSKTTFGGTLSICDDCIGVIRTL